MQKCELLEIFQKTKILIRLQSQIEGLEAIRIPMSKEMNRSICSMFYVFKVNVILNSI